MLYGRSKRGGLAPTPQDLPKIIKRAADSKCIPLRPCSEEDRQNVSLFNKCISLAHHRARVRACLSQRLVHSNRCVPINPKHRKFMQFWFQGVQFQYNRWPFGFSLAPQTFSKCVESSLEPIRRRKFRVLFCLDDLILMSSSSETATLNVFVLRKYNLAAQ